MRLNVKTPLSFFRPLLSVCFVSGALLSLGSQPEAKTLPVNTLPIIDFEEGNLLSVEKKSKWMGTVEKAVTLAVPPEFSPDTTLLRQDAPFYLDVDGYRGIPIVNIPIQMAPGTNGMQPELNIRIDGIDRTGDQPSGMSLTGMKTLTRCGEDHALCLGDEKLIAVKGAAKGTLYTLRNDPRTLVRSMAGGEVYRIENGSGVRRYYTPRNEQTAQTGPWEITAIADWFENFVRYHYAPNSGRIETIEYGQDKTGKENVRSIHFSYARNDQDIPIQITTKVGADIVRQYLIQRNNQGKISSLTECAPTVTEKRACYAPYDFIWALSDDGKSSVLQAVGNGIGGRTTINYQKREGAMTVAAFTLFDKENKMQENRFYFADIQKEGDQLAGFGEFRAHEAGTTNGQYVRLGTDEFAGMTLFEGDMAISKDTEFTAAKINKLSEISYVYAGVINAEPVPYVMVEMAKRSFDLNGKEISSEISKHSYDAKGRIKVTQKGEQLEETTYLDEIDKEFSGEDYGNLVVEQRQIDKNSGAVSSKNWAYHFKENLLFETDISATNNGQPDAAATTKHSLDIHGNLIRIEAQNRTTEIRYDGAHKSFPVSMVMKDGKSAGDVTLEFDPKTGQLISDTLADGSRSLTKLDDMGRVTSEETTIKDPKTTKTSGKKTVEVIKTTGFSEDEFGNVVEARSVHVDNQVFEESFTDTVHYHTDSLGRNVKISSEKRDADDQILTSTSFETHYSDQGQEITFTDETGKRQLMAYNKSGQLIREESDDYGLTKLTYNKKGKVANVVKNGEIMEFDYDDLGRLSEKRLPGDMVFSYSYDKNFPLKVSRVVLPLGREISYTYTRRGQVDTKSVKVPDYRMGFYTFDMDFGYEGSKLKSVVYPDGSKIEYRYEGERLSSINWANEPPKNWEGEDVPIISYHPQFEKDGTAVLNKKLGNGLLEQYRWLSNGKLSGISVARKAKGEKDYRPFSDLAYELHSGTDLLASEQRTEILRRRENLLSQNYSYDKQEQLETLVAKLNGKTADRISFKSFNKRNAIAAKDPQHINVVKKEITLTFDKLGNVSSKKSKAGVQSEFLFDIENRLTQSSASNGRETWITQYDYDHLGERTEKMTEGVSRTLYISPFYEFTEYADGRMQETRYVWDHMGRIAAFTNEVTEEDFAGLFPAIQSAGNISADVGFLGSIWDSASGKITALTTDFLSFTPTKLKSLSPLALLLFVAVLSLLVFEYLTTKNRKPVLFKKGNLQRKPFSLVASVVVMSFFISLSAPSVHATLEGGDGTPKVDHVTYFHHDIRGSVVTVSDEKGYQTASIAYHPYGVVLENDVTAGNDNFRFKFAGMELDSETGLYYDHARYYDPELGKFLSRDQAHSLPDPYGYTQNDPVNYIDPDGRMMTDNPAADISVPVDQPIAAVTEEVVRLHPARDIDRDAGIDDGVGGKKNSAPDADPLDEEQSIALQVPSAVNVRGNMPSLTDWAADQSAAHSSQTHVEMEQRGGPSDVLADVALNVEDAERGRPIDDAGEGDFNPSEPPADVPGAGPYVPQDYDDWVRYPTFFNPFFGVRNGQVAPEGDYAEPVAIARDDRRQFNAEQRSGNMQGWTRTGGYLQSLLGSFLLAGLFPRSVTLEGDASPTPPPVPGMNVTGTMIPTAGDVITAGFGLDLVSYALTITAFSAFGKWYTYNEVPYWDGVIGNGRTATWKDYAKLAARRIVWKTLGQLALFTTFSVISNAISSFPIMDERDHPALTMLRLTLFSLIGNGLMLLYYLPSRPAHKTWDHRMAYEKVHNNDRYNARPWYQRWGHNFRMYVSKNARLDTTTVPNSLQSEPHGGWYPSYVVQMYGWYMLGSLGYYMGNALAALIIPSYTWDRFFKSWLANLTLIILAPAASPFAYINVKPRKSFTWLRKWHKDEPRRPGRKFLQTLGYRLLGPIEGLRLAKFDDEYAVANRSLVSWQSVRPRADAVPPEADSRASQPSRASFIQPALDVQGAD